MDLLGPNEEPRPVEAENSLRRPGVGEVQLTLSDLVEAVLEYAADSHEAAAVIEDLLVTKRVRMTSKRAALRTAVGPLAAGDVRDAR